MMTQEKIKNRIAILKTRHKEMHKIIEALEAEKAPEDLITVKKKEKLSIKDKIANLNSRLN